MPESASLIDHFDVAISHAAAPAFMLGAVAAFLNVLVNRFERAVDRYRTLRGEMSSGAPTDIMASLSARMVILDRAIYFAALRDSETFAVRRDDGEVVGFRWWMPEIVRTISENMLTIDEPGHARLAARRPRRRGISAVRFPGSVLEAALRA